jgi:hypothetical protein
MKKITITLLLIFNAHLFVKAQAKDSLFYYVNKLDWESFGVIPNYATVTYRFDANALKVISVLANGKHSCLELLRYMGRSEKTIAVHAILTKIYCPEELQLTLKSIFKTDANGKILYDKVEGYQFTMNGAAWKLIFAKDTSRYSYIGPQIRTLQLYWKTKIKKNK